jgi:hypothetical protein
MRIGLILLLSTLPAAPGFAQADTSDTTRPRVLLPIQVIGRFDDLIGVARSGSEGRVGSIDLRSRPISREGELLETVPGMIVTQHSGDGKANQYFVRGFNLDHGTDFQTRIEGMPVNMASHAHGQGYTDLNFLIPELVDFIDYRLGIYHAELGDFGSAGGAEFHLMRKLDRGFATIGAGEHGLQRMVAAGSGSIGGGDLLVGGEAKRYNGPWDLEQQTRKYSGMARYSWDRGSSRFSLLGLAYHNRWNSTDQIPWRAVEAGLIGSFGNIDDTDGGNSQRYSLSGSWRHVGTGSVQDVEVFGIYSDLSLFSNFTYFLEDSVRGDQFNQREQRVVVGANVRHTQPVEALGVTHLFKVGGQARADVVNGLGLHRTASRNRFGTIREDDVREYGSGLFVEAESRWLPWFRTVLGVRGDFYRFNVDGDRAENSGTRSDGIISPKVSLIFNPAPGAEFYLSGGLGFHSNDARGTTITVDPVSGNPVAPVDPLVRSRGAELGLRLSPIAGLRSTLVAWTLGLNSELVFIGDGGATEASAASRRQGLTFANFYRPIPQLALDLDVSLARARFAAVPPGENHIPGAVENVVAAGITWMAQPKGIFGAIRLRHFGSYPLIEDNSIRATATTLASGEIGYRFSAGLRLEVSVLNLFDSRENDIQYFYPSRLPGESSSGVDDVHFHPVEPRQIRVALAWGI